MSRARERFTAAPVLAGLTAFQQATVAHVADRFYGPEPSTRFLVADETGLGKSLVARGVIARAIEHLQDDSSVDRIDIVYVCSNADIADQNIRRLDVTGDPHLPFASRLTLLPKHSARLADADRHRFTKPVNLVSFTPATSFEMGWQTGKSEERAMLFLLLADMLDLDGYRRTAALRLLQGGVTSLDRFAGTVARLEAELVRGVDPVVMKAFRKAVRRGLGREFEALVEEMGRRRSVPDELRHDVRTLIGRLRGELARVSVHTLEPDLVILDEFQRFRHLLDPESGGEAAELAHHLFEYGDARVLLLSATPYKPFTYVEESLAGDDHHRDFLQTLRFLANGRSGLSADDVAENLAAYRHAAVTGAPLEHLTARLRAQLLRVMSRTERPQLGNDGMLVEHLTTAASVEEKDLLGYVALREVARAVDGQLALDYWKSAPYFINFMDGYQLADKVRKALDDPDRALTLGPLLRRTQRIDPSAVRRFDPVDMGNARLRQLADETVAPGWWRLLWVPPSLPYTAFEGPYAEPFAEQVTKRLVFSSWAATPTAVAALLSYDVERRLAEGSRLAENTPAARRRIATRLSYRLDSGRPAAMTSLALFWPTPGLARAADPLAWARREPDRTLTASELEQAIAGQLAAHLPAGDDAQSGGGEAWYWASQLSWPDSLPAGLDRDTIIAALGGTATDEDSGDDPTGLAAHVDVALRARANALDLPARPNDLAVTLAAIGAHSPGNIAWRALGRLLNSQTAVTPEGHWRAAAVLASGLRSLFSRLEATLLLDQLLPEEVYWRAVLRYCAWGNLQAALDEYLHHLALDGTAGSLDDGKLIDLADRARNAISLRPSRYEAFDPLNPDRPIPFTSRFALRFGNKRQTDEGGRHSEVRQSFNSPFWPFVLATTSVGQEGIDFHWWSHAVTHWNTPANPVDFEQREGRVHRYAGHAVRRNITHRHRKSILTSEDPNPWAAAYAAATDETANLGDFAPHWIYPGPARIERHIAPYPLSGDIARLERLKRDVALYRLTFGQPRQEDMIELLRRRADGEAGDHLQDMRIDLTPPSV
ncbi:helicase [Planosporangium mesophilum]|uniref:Helicase n=1 Tax=Planosporangium mesophilum TaxID=689768 RepID=A0A8J3X3P4_9ACTN|nr:helicase [Planosporangium mesophilum]NJC86209.1 helicase [Planosporangium mesophilum]GII25699.1 helicase [Planosporangium mesophilum]